MTSSLIAWALAVCMSFAPLASNAPGANETEMTGGFVPVELNGTVPVAENGSSSQKGDVATSSGTQVSTSDGPSGQVAPRDETSQGAKETGLSTGEERGDKGIAIAEGVAIAVDKSGHLVARYDGVDTYILDSSQLYESGAGPNGSPQIRTREGEEVAVSGTTVSFHNAAGQRVEFDGEASRQTVDGVERELVAYPVAETELSDEGVEAVAEEKGGGTSSERVEEQGKKTEAPSPSATAPEMSTIACIAAVVVIAACAAGIWWRKSKAK